MSSRNKKKESFEFYIDHLVFEGISPQQEETIVANLQNELTCLLTQGETPSFPESEETGRIIARTIYHQLSEEKR